MNQIQWIKITTGIFDDQKIKLIEAMPEADSLLIIWLKLLVMAGKINDSGLIYLTERVAYSEEMLANIFGRKITVVRMALQTFERLEMIERTNDGFIEIINWGSHQNVEGLAKIREQNRLRQQRYRDKNKLLKEGKSITLRDVNPLISYSSSYSSSKEEKDENFKARPSSVEQVTEYMKSKGYKDPESKAEAFVDHYESNGWKVGKNSMKDWKAAARNWNRRKFSNNSTTASQPTAPKLDVIKVKPQ